MRPEIAICAIAKNEDLYIEEWIDYHLNEVGVDHIYVFDNNDELTPTIQRIKENYSNVTIFDFNGEAAFNRIGWQCGAYRLFYREFNCEYDWIAFIDVDEFIETTRPLKEILSEKTFDNTDVVVINWRTYGDNDLVRYDDRPVRERFSKPAPDDLRAEHTNEPDNFVIKSIVRGERPFTYFSPHHQWFDGCIYRHIDGYQVETPRFIINKFTRKNGCLNHYRTKTIEEFIWRRIIFPNGKIKTIDQYSKKEATSIEKNLDMFFKTNKHTPEKDAIVKEMFSELRRRHVLQ